MPLVKICGGEKMCPQSSNEWFAEHEKEWNDLRRKMVVEVPDEIVVFLKGRGMRIEVAEPKKTVATISEEPEETKPRARR